MNPLTGQQFEIRHGSSYAVITEVGAHLRLFQTDARDVVVPFAEDELPPASNGAVLAPWPNRLRDGQYHFDGTDYQVPLTEPARRTALHGLVSWLRWGVRSHTASAVELAVDLPPTPGYPFPLTVSTRYELSQAGLEVTTTGTNTGQTDAPYGVGFHPWLSPGPGALDDAELELDVARWVTTDERLLPTGAEELPQQFDFRARRALGSTDLDDAFLDPAFDADGRSWLRLHGSDGRTVEVWMDSSLRAWQLCTGDHVSAPAAQRTGLAAEPMSCIADAFRTGDDLVRLSPGDRYTVHWGLRLR
ncbi:aldose 1-epimerase family protein [Ruania albidiflava]|uniref:aldose 1-epimerase family protein n=1 Tax=Ruania albidiflava TaxID=366586 RepID=UPI0003B481BA|nr:aldose 1-epimerase family protein [Ruania albidiflava]